MRWLVEELVGQWVHSDLSSSRNDQSKCWWCLIYKPKPTQTLPLADIMHHVRRELTIIEELLGWREWPIKGLRRVRLLELGLGAGIRVGALKAKFSLYIVLNQIYPYMPPSYHILCPVCDILEHVQCSDGPITWTSIRIGFKGYCFGSVVVTNSIFKKTLHFRLWGGCPFIIHLDVPYSIRLTRVLSGLPGERPWSQGKIGPAEKMRCIITNQMVLWNNEHLQPC